MNRHSQTLSPQGIIGEVLALTCAGVPVAALLLGEMGLLLSIPVVALSGIGFGVAAVVVGDKRRGVFAITTCLIMVAVLLVLCLVVGPRMPFSD